MHSVVYRGPGSLFLCVWALIVDCVMQTNTVLEMAQTKRLQYEKQRDGACSSLRQVVVEARKLLKDIHNTSKAFVEMVSVENKKITGFQSSLQTLEAATTHGELQFADPQTEFHNVSQQAVAQLKSIRSASKRRRSSLLKTLAALGTDDDERD